MSRDVYLPLFKVGVAYMVQQGRAWTALEHALLLRLVSEPSTLEQLREVSAMPIRLVIEALMELMGVGWVALRAQNSEVRFAATAEGERQAKKSYLPAHTSPLRRSDTLCLDRLVGCALDPDDLTLVHRDKIPQDADILPARTFKPELRPSDSIERLYMEEQETFQEWVDHRLHSQNFFALVRVAGDDIHGLPEYAPLSLRQAILEEAFELDQNEDSMDVSGVSSYSPSRRYFTDFGADDIIVGGDAHRHTLERVLKSARSTVIIHSCFASAKTISKIMPMLIAAAERGVNIDLLWGLRYAEAADWAKAGLNAARKLIDQQPEKIRQKLRFADGETGSHAKILMADSGRNGKFEGFLGSCNWLSTDFDWTEMSVRIRDPRPLAELAGLLATLRLPNHGEWGADVHRLVRLKRKLLDERPLHGSVRMDILVDREHLAVVRHARDNAKTQIVSGCDLLGPAGETSVFVPMRTAAASGTPVELMYNRPTTSISPDALEAMRAELSHRGVKLTDVGRAFHAKFLLWDGESLCVTSFNWLATTPDRWKPNGAEIGILVTGDHLSSAALSKLSPTNLS